MKTDIKKLTIQTDIRWRNEIMTYPKCQKYPDVIGLLGCLVNCYSNIVQMSTKIEFTPIDMNDMLVKNNGYNYLRNPKCEVGSESLMLFDVVEKFLHWEIEKIKYGEYVYHNRVFYVARVIHPRTRKGHYINVLRDFNSKLICFDGEYGELVLTSNVSWLLKVTI